MQPASQPVSPIASQSVVERCHTFTALECAPLYPSHTNLLISNYVLRAIEAVGSRSGATTASVRIAACGQLETSEAVEESRATSVIK